MLVNISVDKTIRVVEDVIVAKLAQYVAEMTGRKIVTSYNEHSGAHSIASCTGEYERRPLEEPEPGPEEPWRKLDESQPESEQECEIRWYDHCSGGDGERISRGRYGPYHITSRAFRAGRRGRFVVSDHGRKNHIIPESCVIGWRPAE